jgi:phage repressor protein C with HTH and peptisase S24 domain
MKNIILLIVTLLLTTALYSQKGHDVWKTDSYSRMNAQGGWDEFQDLSILVTFDGNKFTLYNKYITTIYVTYLDKVEDEDEITFIYTGIIEVNDNSESAYVKVIYNESGYFIVIQFADEPSSRIAYHATLLSE